MTAENTPTMQDQLEALEREEREAARVARDKENAKRLERANLRKKGVAKYGGEEGKTFVIIDTPIGFFLAHKVGGVIFKQLRKSELTDPDVEEFVKAHLEAEDHERFIKCITDFDATLNTVFLAGCSKMHGANLETREKK